MTNFNYDTPPNERPVLVLAGEFGLDENGVICIRSENLRGPSFVIKLEKEGICIDEQPCRNAISRLLNYIRVSNVEIQCGNRVKKTEMNPDHLYVKGHSDRLFDHYFTHNGEVYRLDGSGAIISHDGDLFYKVNSITLFWR